MSLTVPDISQGNFSHHPHSDLLHAKANFLNELSKKKRYDGDSIIFMDEFDLDISMNKILKIPEGKNLSIFLSITKSGKIVKPLIISPPCKRAIKYPEGFLTLISSGKDFDQLTCLLKWVHVSLLDHTKGHPSLLLIDSWRNHRSKNFKELLSQNQIELLELPPGLNCVLNPLKDIISILNKFLFKKLNEMTQSKHDEIKLEKLYELVMTGIEEIIKSNSELIASSFNTFKSD